MEATACIPYPVGAAGNRARYPCGMYVVREKRGFLNQFEWYRANVN